MLSKITTVSHFIHRNFLVLLISAYVLAAIYPQLGTSIRQIYLGEIRFDHTESIKLSLSSLLLGLLLFNAGLGVKLAELKKILHKPLTLISGLLGNILFPMVIILGMSRFLGLWHNPDEAQNLMMGMALIVAMPIAGSSTAWSQNTNGNVGLSLGLVLFSTLLSPVTTPWIFHTFAHLTTGDYSEDLFELARQGTDIFMGLVVVLPSILGLLVHKLIGEEKAKAIGQYLKLSNFVVLLLLNYINASTALPFAFKQADCDLLIFISATATILCVIEFFAGYLLAYLLHSDKADRVSLVFGLGMNNNGTGLVLATATIADHKLAMLPLIFYTLCQQIVAGIFDLVLAKEKNSE